jgi:hypothetical protein
MKSWMFPFEFLLEILLFSYSFKSHSNINLSFLFEIKESVRILQLVEIPLYILVVIYILHELGSPFTTLLIVHELFTVKVVEQYSDF